MGEHFLAESASVFARVMRALGGLVKAREEVMMGIGIGRDPVGEAWIVERRRRDKKERELRIPNGANVKECGSLG